MIGEIDDTQHPLHLLLAKVACANSPLHCEKMRFGAAAVTKDGKVIATAFNKRREGDIFCKGKCIRHQITSRDNPSIGGCDHAFLVLLTKLWQRGFPLASFQGDKPEISLYEAGFSGSIGQWKPWVAKPDPDGGHRYTCIICPPLLLAFGITKVQTWKLNQDGIPKITEIDLHESLAKDSRIALERILPQLG